MSNKLEQLEFKSEKIIGIEKNAGKVRKYFFQILPEEWLGLLLAKSIRRLIDE